MAWATPPTAVTGTVWTATNMNVYRDDLIQLSTALLIPTMQSGQAYGSQGRVLLTPSTAVANRLYGMPFHVPAGITLASIKFSATAVGNVRVGVYSDNVGLPGALIQGSASTACANPTTVTFSQALSGPALYWLAAVFSGTPTISAIITNSLFANGAGFVYRAFTFAALPDPFGSVSWPTPVTSADCPDLLAALA